MKTFAIRLGLALALCFGPILAESAHAAPLFSIMMRKGRVPPPVVVGISTTM